MMVVDGDAHGGVRRSGVGSGTPGSDPGAAASRALVANVDREQSSRRVTALKNGGRLVGQLDLRERGVGLRLRHAAQGGAELVRSRRSARIVERRRALAAAAQLPDVLDAAAAGELPMLKNNIFLIVATTPAAGSASRRPNSSGARSPTSS